MNQKAIKKHEKACENQLKINKNQSETDQKPIRNQSKINQKPIRNQSKLNQTSIKNQWQINVIRRRQMFIMECPSGEHRKSIWHITVCFETGGIRSRSPQKAPGQNSYIGSVEFREDIVDFMEKPICFNEKCHFRRICSYILFLIVIVQFS